MKVALNTITCDTWFMVLLDGHKSFFLVYYNSLVWTQKVVLPVPALKIAVTCGHINETFNIFFGTYRM
jgi:hypothetical protein